MTQMDSGVLLQERHGQELAVGGPVTLQRPLICALHEPGQLAGHLHIPSERDDRG
jgi:hypothetical protein